MKPKIRGITFAAAVAAVYSALFFVPGVQLMSYSAIQFRVSEVLTIMPLYSPYGIMGVAAGCLISNIIGSPIGLPDIILGTAATAAAAILTYLTRRLPRFIALLPQVILNGVIIGYALTVFYTPQVDNFIAVLAYNMLTVAIGEAGVVYALGLPLSYLIDRRKLFK